MKLSQIALLALSVLPISALAQNKLELNYDGFFDRMKDLEEPEYQGVKLAFYLMDREGSPCPVSNAKLSTKVKEQEVYVLENGELLLPYEPLLDQDKALLLIDKKDDRECGLNMRLESNILFNDKVSKQQALELTNKFAAAFDDLGGMMSFMLPKVEGITFQFAPEVAAEIAPEKLGKCDDNKCTVMKGDLVKFDGQLTFNNKPVKVVPYIQ